MSIAQVVKGQKGRMECNSFDGKLATGLNFWHSGHFFVNSLASFRIVGQ